MEIKQLSSQLLKGDKSSLAKAITLVESTLPKHRKEALSLIQEILPHTGNSIRIGITGVPGVGKSTFIEAFGMHLITQGKKVAVLAIDPSSSKSGGSILGDKTRMNHLASNENAFIRPTAAGKSLGGVAYATKEAILLCEAAGYDIIIVETVGVGQSEIAVNQITDFFLLLMLSGAGDELQGIKRGIIEMSDAMVITKADGDNVAKAKSARNEYARAMHFLPKNEYGWIPKVMTCSALLNEGIDEIWLTIQEYIQLLKQHNNLQNKRNQQELTAYDKMIEQSLLNQLFQSSEIIAIMNQQKASITEGKQTAYNAVAVILEQIRIQLKQ